MANAKEQRPTTVKGGDFEDTKHKSDVRIDQSGAPTQGHQSVLGRLDKNFLSTAETGTAKG